MGHVEFTEAHDRKLPEPVMTCMVPPGAKAVHQQQAAVVAAQLPRDVSGVFSTVRLP